MSHGLILVVFHDVLGHAHIPCNFKCMTIVIFRI
nr:MAG TPA: hypothetical protein [Caudoviricetes sp.]